MTIEQFLLAFSLLLVSTGSILVSSLLVYRRLRSNDHRDEGTVLVTLLVLGQMTAVCMIVSLGSWLTGPGVLVGSLVLSGVVGGLAASSRPAGVEQPGSATGGPPPSAVLRSSISANEPGPLNRALTALAGVI
ncbi:MAG: hypothetical protein HY815_26395 [Candidatus Riflebacteria bacterium]|nr:hypothetical protein [Candidatus Riflebacteria bacterium]